MAFFIVRDNVKRLHLYLFLIITMSLSMLEERPARARGTFARAMRSGSTYAARKAIQRLVAPSWVSV